MSLTSPNWAGVPDRDDIKREWPLEGSGRPALPAGNCQQSRLLARPAGLSSTNRQQCLRRSAPYSGCALFREVTHRHGPDGKRSGKPASTIRKQSYQTIISKRNVKLEE